MFLCVRANRVPPNAKGFPPKVATTSSHSSISTIPVMASFVSTCDTYGIGIRCRFFFSACSLFLHHFQLLYGSLHTLLGLHVAGFEF